MVRREFLTASAVVLTAASARRVHGANERVRLAVMGVNSRGAHLASTFAQQPDVEIATICDVDSRAVDRVVALVDKATGKKPAGVGDVRKVLDDPGIDALVIAAPDHWHGPAAIMAVQAGKHVFVEKPACHNPREGELMIAAARKHGKVMQVGTQRRSMPAIREAIEKVHGGALGRVLWARGWYNADRKSIGHGKTASVPDWLDYHLWQGPAPERPYKDNLIHYNWHWFWHWGTAETGNNAIHALDVCRWGLGVDYPRRVTSGGQKLRWDDDQETPDTQVATFDFDGKSITYEGHSWNKRGFEGSGFGVAFYGEKGSLVLDGAKYKIYDPDGKETGGGAGSFSDGPHHRNFLDCMKTGSRPNADIEEGHKSTLLCHLANIAWRTGKTLHLDPKTGRPKGDKEAMALWSREYRKGWEPKV